MRRNPRVKLDLSLKSAFPTMQCGHFRCRHPLQSAPTFIAFSINKTLLEIHLFIQSTTRNKNTAIALFRALCGWKVRTNHRHNANSDCDSRYKVKFLRRTTCHLGRVTQHQKNSFFTRNSSCDHRLEIRTSGNLCDFPHEPAAFVSAISVNRFI